MAMPSDGGVHETTDSTTSFESQESTTSTVYTRQADGEEPEREEGTGADEVNPRQLLKDPHVNDIRWLARTSWGGKLVTKPIDDSFKYGFEILDEEGEDQANVRDILDDLDWEYHYKRAQKKARTDGFALVFAVLEDNSDVNTDPLSDEVDVQSVQKLQVLKLDDLAKFEDDHPATGAGRGRESLVEGIEDTLDRDVSDFEIRRTGLVIDKDPNSPTYREPLGYLVGKDDPKGLDEVEFVHHNRVVHHLVWNNWVDGDLDSETLGEWEGDSILTSSYHLLRGLKKGNWSIMQTLFRYASKLYHVEMPEDANEEDFDQAFENMTNMNAMSELVTPAGYEIDDFGTDGQLEPRDYFDVIFEQVCAGQEMTKSVLFGTQTGTVSGSETDIKNYFNRVERLRTGRITDDMHAFVTWHQRVTDARTNDDYEAEFDVEWGPLFKMTDLDRAETLTRTMQTLTAAINSFVMTPAEARSILQEEWAEFDMNADDDELTDEEREFIEAIQVAQMGTEASLTNPNEQEGVQQGSTQQQNGGGREQGQTSDPSNPTSDRGLSSREMDEIADRVARRLQ